MLMNSKKFDFMNAVFISLDDDEGTDRPTDRQRDKSAQPFIGDPSNFCLDSFSPVVTLCLHVCVCLYV